MIIVDPGPCPVVAGDFGQPCGAMVDYDDVLAGHGPRADGPGPSTGRFRSDHRGVLLNSAGKPERERVGGIGDPVQPWGFLGKHNRRFASGHAVFTVVHFIHEWQKRHLEFSLLVVGQHIRRRAVQDPEAQVQGRE
jgi:hypothetical protein